MYDYIITKPELNEDTLAHYGVKGMKWRKRHAKKISRNVVKGKKVHGNNERMYDRLDDYYNGLHGAPSKDLRKRADAAIYKQNRIWSADDAERTGQNGMPSKDIKKRNNLVKRKNKVYN